MRRVAHKSVRKTIKIMAATTTFTSGFFIAPFLPAAELPSLRIFVSSNENQPGIATVILNAAENGSKVQKFKQTLNVPANGAGSVTVELAKLEGTAVEVEVITTSKLLKPSVALIETFTGDGTEDMELFIAPQQFSEVAEIGSIPRTPMLLSTGLFPIPKYKGNKPEIRLYISSFSNVSETAEVTIYGVQGGEKKQLLRRNLQIPSGGLVSFKRDVSDLEGNVFEATLLLPSGYIKPSGALVKVFLADGGEQIVVWLSPEQFAKLS